MKKTSYWLTLAQFKVGAILFPVLEPVFRVCENLNPKVRKYFFQALHHIEKNNFGAALLNLNMVLSLRPDHFLARLCRGRLYVHDGRYRLASEDYLRANQISGYRFIHYDLYREYLRSVNRGIEHMGVSIANNFSQAFEILRQAQDNLARERETDTHTPPEPAPLRLDESMVAEDDERADSEQTAEEAARFKSLGPITQQEVEATDWARLIKQLSS